MCVREQGTGCVQITPGHSAWFESLGVLLPESGFEMVLCGRHCLTFGEKYLENQWVLGNQLLWAWLIYRCNLRTWFSFWSRDAYLLSLSTWGLSAWWTFSYSFCCVGAKVVDLLWANILLCPEEDWHVIRFQWSINRDLFFVTQVFSLSLSLWFSIITPWNGAGCFPPAFVLVAPSFRPGFGGSQSWYLES